jgi:protein TonB
MFAVWLFLMIAAALGSGWYLHTIKMLPPVIEQAASQVRARFIIDDEQRAPLPPPVEKKKPKELQPIMEPVDLTKKPVVVQQETPVTEAPPQTAQATPAPRAVFGLRRVYSVGLGSGGAATDAIVSKIGNTINKEYDTIVATESDIKGTVVSTATVTTAPRFRKVVKPEYTREMIDRKIEGTVKVRVLVDIDGKVKKATCLNDIGFDSAAQAVKATLAMEFDPALRGENPVAVWIIVPIRFILLG